MSKLDDLCVWWMSSTNDKGTFETPKYCLERGCTGVDFSCSMYYSKKKVEKKEGENYGRPKDKTGELS